MSSFFRPSLPASSPASSLRTRLLRAAPSWQPLLHGSFLCSSLLGSWRPSSRQPSLQQPSSTAAAFFAAAFFAAAFLARLHRRLRQPSAAAFAHCRSAAADSPPAFSAASRRSDPSNLCRLLSCSCRLARRSSAAVLQPVPIVRRSPPSAIQCGHHDLLLFLVVVEEIVAFVSIPACFVVPIVRSRIGPDLLIQSVESTMLIELHRRILALFTQSVYPTCTATPHCILNRDGAATKNAIAPCLGF